MIGEDSGLQNPAAAMVFRKATSFRLAVMCVHRAIVLPTSSTGGRRISPYEVAYEEMF